MADIVRQTRHREHDRSLRRLSGLQPTDHHNKRLSVSHSGQVNRCLTAQLEYTALAIHTGSHWKIQDRRQIQNTDNTQTKHNPAQKKQTTQNTAKQN